VKSSQEVSYDFKILNAVMDVNERQKLHLMPKIKKYFKDNLKGKHFALWGWPSNLIQTTFAKLPHCT